MFKTNFSGHSKI